MRRTMDSRWLTVTISENLSSGANSPSTTKESMSPACDLIFNVPQVDTMPYLTKPMTPPSRMATGGLSPYQQLPT